MTVKHKVRVLELELSVARSLCESIGTPRALSVWTMLKYEQWDELLRLEIDPRHYQDAKAFSDDYLVTEILKKNPRLPTGIDTDAVAIDKFWGAEKQCTESNARISAFNQGAILPSRDIVQCLEKAQSHIARILGPLSRSKLSFAEEHMRFGPGATTSLSGVVTQGKKYSHRALDATPRVLPFRAFGFPEKWKPFAAEISLRRASKMRIVPKNAKTGRTICIEPDLNIFVQLGQGALIRNQLLRSGLDLNTQSWNQWLARVAWEEDLCTMDLSGASDSICREAVWFLLPFEWADFLHFSRVDFVESEGKEVELAKWSSMGNGYTFELETLLFYGVLLGACEQLGLEVDYVSAYGDDLIFPNQARELVEGTLNFLGFKVNREKTFGKGIFHESCGTDWFMGHNVRPFFMRTEHHDFPTVCYITANGLVHWAHRRIGGGARDARLLPAWLRCYSACPATSRHRIPSGFGDVGFVSCFDEARPALSRKARTHGWSGYDFSFRDVRPVMMRISEEGCLTAFLNGNSSTFSFGRESIRGRFRPAVTRRGFSLDWPHWGPWLNA
jgi:hypothetical protein